MSELAKARPCREDSVYRNNAPNTDVASSPANTPRSVHPLVLDKVDNRAGLLNLARWPKDTELGIEQYLLMSNTPTRQLKRYQISLKEVIV